ncbi:MAG: lactonase family protein [Prevotella sp.]|nr:lactonase family protein [Prevotella sp.]
MNARTFLLGCIAAALPSLCMAGNDLDMVVGTYTDAGSEGLYSFSFNQSTGVASLRSTLKVKNPSYLTFSHDGRHIYAVSENNDATAALNSIAFDPVTGNMDYMNSQLTHGEDPCYVETDGKVALTANYSGGSLSVFPIQGNGTLGKMAIQFAGSKGGPDRKRQNTPHIHCVRLAPDGFVLATDFSADRILTFKYNKENGTLTAYGIATHIQKDSGPRHLVFSPDGRHAYLMSELSGKVTVFDYANGELKETQSILADDAHARGGADIRISPDGRFVYASTRLKEDGITIFRVEPTGKLVRIGKHHTGTHPRYFTITPNGKYLLAACRDSNKIQVFSRDRATGQLRDTHQDIELSHPVCIQFCPAS